MTQPQNLVLKELKIIDMMKQKANLDGTSILAFVTNKIDLYESQKVSHNDGKAFAEKIMQFFRLHRHYLIQEFLNCLKILEKHIWCLDLTINQEIKKSRKIKLIKIYLEAFSVN